MDVMPPEAIVLTVQQVAKKLQISKNQAYLIVGSGQIKAKKVGGNWRITPEALTQYLAAPNATAKGDQIL